MYLNICGTENGKMWKELYCESCKENIHKNKKSYMEFNESSFKKLFKLQKIQYYDVEQSL